MLGAGRTIGAAGRELFSALPPLAGILCLALVLAITFILLFRALSPRRRVLWLKDQMVAAIYELRLFADSPRRVLLTQLRALRLALEYLAWTLPSLALVLPLAGVLLAQGMLIWEHQPLATGEQALLSVTLEPEQSLSNVKIEALDRGLVLDPPAARIGSTREIFQRVRALNRGEYRLSIRLGAQRVEKSLQVGGGGPVSLYRSRAEDWTSLLSLEKPLPDKSGIQRIAIDYSERSLCWLGLPWYGILLISSMLFFLILRRGFRVVI
jgi:hypothetical protein